MPLFPPTVPDYADPGYTRTYTKAWYDVTIGAPAGALMDIGLYNVTTGALIGHTGAVLSATSVGLSAATLGTPFTVAAGTRVATTFTADNTTITLRSVGGTKLDYFLPLGSPQYGGINTTTANCPLQASVPSLTAATAPGRIYGVMFT